MKRIFLALVAALLPIAAAAPALAHTAVRETSIADNATLSTAPPTFTVTFSAATGLASVTLTNAAGREVVLDYTPPRTRAATFTIPLPALAPGAYTISWRTMASDGHVMPGAVHFTVAG
ncbi:MAG: copper resistance protein CopC [Hyphomonadaceae bacterium]|nr:copper resistance protein CopC [Hyphomonadaceae bacterium]